MQRILGALRRSLAVMAMCNLQNAAGMEGRAIALQNPSSLKAQEGTLLEVLNDFSRRLAADDDGGSEIAAALLAPEGAWYQYCRHHDYQARVWRAFDGLMIKIIKRRASLSPAIKSAMSSEIVSFVATSLAADLFALYDQATTCPLARQSTRLAGLRLQDGYAWLTTLVQNDSLTPDELAVAQLTPSRLYDLDDPDFSSETNAALHFFAGLASRGLFIDHARRLLEANPSLLTSEWTATAASRLQQVLSPAL